MVQLPGDLSHVDLAVMLPNCSRLEGLNATAVAANASEHAVYGQLRGIGGDCSTGTNFTLTLPPTISHAGTLEVALPYLTEPPG